MYDAAPDMIPSSLIMNDPDDHHYTVCDRVLICKIFYNSQRTGIHYDDRTCIRDGGMEFTTQASIIT